VSSHLPAGDLPTLIGALVIGALWLRHRNRLTFSSSQLAGGIWLALGVLFTIAALGVWTATRNPAVALPAPWHFQPLAWLGGLGGLAIAFLAAGGGDALSRDAHEFGAPRIVAIRRVAIVTMTLGLVALVVPGVVFSMLVPDAGPASINAPLAALVDALRAPAWVIALLHTLLVGAVALLLIPAPGRRFSYQRLVRLATDHAVPELLAAPDRAGVLTRAVSAGAIAIVPDDRQRAGAARRLMWLASASRCC
jgi:hypothetical protein